MMDRRYCTDESRDYRSPWNEQHYVGLEGVGDL